MAAMTTTAVMALALSCAPGLDPAMLTGIARQESGLDPARISAPNRNGSRDYGLMQINESNFAWLGLTARTALDPCASLGAAARLLASFSRYNTGSPRAGLENGYAGAVVAAIRAVKADPPAAPTKPAARLSDQFTAFRVEETN